MGTIRPKIIPSLLACLIALSFASQFWAIDPTLARWHTIWSIILLLGLFCIWGLGQILPAPRWHTIWNHIISAVVGINGAVALAQFVRQREVGLGWLGEKEQLRPSGGFSIIQIGETLTLRAYGLTAHPNILGGLLAAALIILIIQNPALDWANKAMMWLGFCGLLVTFSRSGWLAFGFVLLLLFIYRQSNFLRQKFARLSTNNAQQPYPRHLFSALALPLGLFILLNFNLIQARLQPNSVAEWRSISERIVSVKHALILIQQHPLKGVGAGNFSATLPFGSVKGLQPVHHTLLLLSAELGIAAGLIWLAITILPLWITYKRTQSGHATQFEIALAAALLTCAITDQFDMYAWHWAYGRTTRWLLLTLWLVEAERKQAVA